VGLRFLLGFETPKVQAMLSIARYVEFVGGFLLAFGLVFQMPVVVFFLTKLGLLTPKALRRRRRIAIVVIFVLAGVLTPPDVMSQLLMAAPMLLLYEVSIVGSVIAARGRTGSATGNRSA
jgi:sec-independent protein translocase protein TatC